MYGWRARIGKVEPSRGDTYQYEFYQIAPKGVVLVVSIIGLFNLVKDELSAAYLKYKAAARDLAEVGVDVIALGGSPVFQLKGFGSDIEMIQEIEKDTGIPTTTGLTAEVEAMRLLKMKRIVIATPFKEDANQRSAAWYEKAGFEVLNIKGLGIDKPAEMSRLPFYTPYQLAREAFLETTGADGIFIACPRWGTIEIIDKLEQDMGVPVVTGSQAATWAALRKAHVRESIQGYGKLLQI